jgi:hypothetical protein
VAGDEISSPGKWGHSAECTVYVAEVNNIDPDPTESCVNSDVNFTADPNPPGKTLETGAGPKVLNTSLPGIYCYRARNCKDYGCTDCNWVQSDDVNVVDVAKVVKQGTTDEGPLYVCVGEDVNLGRCEPGGEDQAFVGVVSGRSADVASAG